MKLSLWQQFSSNHSADFTVIGRFENRDAARVAFGKWQTLIDGVREWRHAHPDEDCDILTPIEQS